MEDRGAQIALAQSAAPEIISRGAEVLVLGLHGYELHSRKERDEPQSKQTETFGNNQTPGLSNAFQAAGMEDNFSGKFLLAARLT
jgi:hypothetical protein